jgi:hypothetical protein
MPAMLPFLQLGNSSELGRAVAELTGLSELTDLAKHAAKTKSKVSKDLTNDRRQEIETQDGLFNTTRGDLNQLFMENPSLKPNMEIPTAGDDPRTEEGLEKLNGHLLRRKEQAFAEAVAILGSGFDPANESSRRDVEQNIAPARAELSNIGRLSSASRLRDQTTIGRAHEHCLKKFDLRRPSSRNSPQTRRSLAGSSFTRGSDPG